MTSAARVTPLGDAGFTLLEVMASTAIMAVALVMLVGVITNNVRSTNRAKLMTAGTFLARAKIVEIEDRVLQLGFSDTEESDAGDFSTEGYPSYRWTSLVERVELPGNLTQDAQQASQNKMTQSQAQANPMMAMSGFLGGFMSTLIDPIRIGLQESVRRVTVKVMWDEISRGEQTLEVITFMTDPSRLDLAMPSIPGVGGGTGGASGNANGVTRTAGSSVLPTPVGGIR